MLSNKKHASIFYWLHPLLMVVLVLLPQFFRNVLCLDLLAVVFAVYCFIGFMVFLIKALWSKEGIGTTVPLILSVLVFTLYFFFRSDLLILSEKISLVFDSKFVVCKERAIPVGSRGFLGVCESVDKTVSAISPDMMDMIIYDSTDEIARAGSDRSEDWKRAALRLEIPVRGSPADIAGKTGESNYVIRITDHYYYFQFCSGCGGVSKKQEGMLQ